MWLYIDTLLIVPCTCTETKLETKCYIKNLTTVSLILTSTCTQNCPEEV